MQFTILMITILNKDRNDLNLYFSMNITGALA